MASEEYIAHARQLAEVARLEHEAILRDADRQQAAELRRRYAMAALTGLLANPSVQASSQDAAAEQARFVEAAFVFADKMIKREKL